MPIPYQLISKANFSIVPAKRSRKNKHRQFYTWILERFVNTPRSSKSYDLDHFPSSSEQTGIQLVKKDFIKAMNQHNLFDFEFLPKKRDYLSIQFDDNKDVYLHLIFLDKNWQEEHFSDTLRNINSDRYILFTEGKFELSK